MRKLSQLSFALLLALPWMAGCHSGDQGPSAEQTKLANGSGMNNPRYTTPGPDYTNIRPVPSDYNPNNPAVTMPLRTDTLPNIDWDHPPADMVVVTVHFDFDQFNIQPDDRKLLEAAAKTIAADPTMRVVAVGHCDHFGSEQYNLALGDRRSNAVKAYLTRNGAGDGQTEILSRGKFGAVPDVGKNSPEAKNDRRVDVVRIPAGVTLPPPPTTAATSVAP
ncbi:MAG TPA: OmpA family protein [Opitutales bacterium]|nr:OmpA family protein [Opitutales bacterium]